MTKATQQKLAQQVHAGTMRLVIAATGGGSSAISALLGEPGASRSVLAAVVPYSAEALGDFLGARPEAFCSATTARAMAMAAYLKARAYDAQATTGGVACTASLTSDRPKRGPHRLHVAWQTAATTAIASLELEKGRRDRAQEEAVAGALLLNAVAEACGADARVDVPLARGECPQTARIEAPAEQQDLLAGRTQALPLGAATRGDRPRVVFPGAFNPLHEGHRRMIAVAAAMLGHDVALEISIDNVDKPPLDYIEIDNRLRQFTPDDAVWLTRAPTFVEKAELFAGATFVVGIDTIERIGQERYYGHAAALEGALQRIARNGCRFLVFGRARDGRFVTLADLQLPDTLVTLCRGVPENAFRADISSTQLRRGSDASPRSASGGSTLENGGER